MKQYSKKLFSLAVLCSTATVMLQASNDNGNHVVPFLQWRSQGRAMDRKLYGTTSWSVYQGDMDNNYGTFNVTLQYDQTFRGNELAHCLFGPALIENVTSANKCDNDCGSSAIVISGLESVTAPATRGARELMAENFLLPRDFKSVVTFSPKVQDVVVDLNLFVGLDRWVSGLYFRLYGPIVWNKASLKPAEAIAEDSFADGYQQGFFDPATEAPVSGLFKNALSFFGGCELPGYDAQSVKVQPLRFAKFSDCPVATTNSCDNDCNSSSHHKTGFAELRGEFGYNYIQEKYRLLINLQAAAPTGSKVNAEYLFPAQVGNGHHWELGVGLGGAWRMWSSEDMEKSFNFIVEADITHLFNAKQQRTFDLKCKPLSRYMLAQKLVDVTDEAEQLTAPAGTAQFNAVEGEYAPVANFSTRNVKVSIGVQGDLVAMFNYTCRGFSWDLGYNFWAMSSSKISLKCDENNCDTDSCNPVIVPFPADTWALKGDASVAGYASDEDDAPYFGLGATESKATIFAGTGTGLNLNNANIDPTVTAARADVETVDTALVVFGTTTPINSSSDPLFISIDDLDVAGAEQRGLSHKVFTHFNYTWRDVSDRWMPYVGAGFSAEFGSHSSSNDCDTTTTDDCNTCPSSLSCALSKWAVEIKGGVSFH